MPVLTSKKQFKRSSVTTGETKRTKIQNLSEGPETFGFFGFPRDMSRHDVVKRHDFRSAMKSKEKLSSMTTMRFDGIYNGKEASIYIYIYT